MTDRSLSAREAVKLLGREVRSSHEHTGLPAGTPGRIVRIHRQSGCDTGFRVAVQWQWPGRPGYDEFSKAELERFLMICDPPAGRCTG